MQASSFADIISAVELVEKRVQNRQLTNREISAAGDDAKVHILGLPVVSAKGQAAAADRMIQHVIFESQRYASAAEVLKAELAQASVGPIVILPPGLWSAIAKKSNLYTFFPREDGSVLVSVNFTRLPKDVVTAAKNAKSLWLSGIAGSMYFLTSTALFLFTASNLGIFSGYVSSSFVGSLIGSGILGVISTFVIRGVFEHWLRNHARLIRKEVKKAGGIHRFLWPENTDWYERFNSWKRHSSIKDEFSSIKVGFPTPPQEVQEILSRMYEARLTDRMRLTVDTGAITFVTDPMKMMIASAKGIALEMIASTKGIALEMKEQKRRYAADPIVTVASTDGHAVAIIAQYGDFPVEEEAVKKAVAEYSFLD
ncbi:MAG: hypothetical protein RI935_507 [Candidatus Parcubacteria bacterium]|jgi:hypothetical protein